MYSNDPAPPGSIADKVLRHVEQLAQADWRRITTMKVGGDGNDVVVWLGGLGIGRLPASRPRNWLGY
jgi:hypothetical protein